MLESAGAAGVMSCRRGGPLDLGSGDIKMVR